MYFGQVKIKYHEVRAGAAGPDIVYCCTAIMQNIRFVGDIMIPKSIFEQFNVIQIILYQ